MKQFNTKQDAQTNFINDGLLEAADLDREDEIVECVYRNDYSLQDALNELGAWLWT